MNKTITFAILTSAFLSQGAHARAIYGIDNRVEVSNATPSQQKLAQSAAVMISKSLMTLDSSRPGVVQFKQRTLKEWLEAGINGSGEEKRFSSMFLASATDKISFCEGERFVDQPNPGQCSGFLIAPDLVVTAGHCANQPSFCEEYRWVFDFNLDPETKSAGVDFKEENIYSCKKVVSGFLSVAFGIDYAVVQLDRVVTGREPLEIRTEDKTSDNANLVIIGSPSGLPLKVASGAKVRNNEHAYKFVANLDSYSGNSGSAVINDDTGIVEGILVNGEDDFVGNKAKRCIESKRCLEDGCMGEGVTRLTAIPEIAVHKEFSTAAETGDTLNLKRLLQLDLWPDFYTKDGVSALMKAAEAGQLATMQLLIAYGADVNLRDAQGNTAVLYAAKGSHVNAIKLLVEAGADKDATNNSGESIGNILKKAGEGSQVQELVSLGIIPKKQG